jgi:hypothetical protein
MKKVVKKGHSPVFQLEIPDELKRRFMEMPLGEKIITHDECPEEVKEIITMVKTVVGSSGEDLFRGTLGVHGRNSDSSYHPPLNDVFARFVIHLGNVTGYRVTADTELKMTHGSYFILGPAKIMPCTVSTVRPRFQPRNYRRVTIVIDFIQAIEAIDETVENIKGGNLVIDENVERALKGLNRVTRQ